MARLLAMILLAMNVPALAVDRTFQIEVENSLKEAVPSNWWLRAEAAWRRHAPPIISSALRMSDWGKPMPSAGCGAAEEIGEVLPVRHQKTVRNHLCGLANAWQLM